MPYRRLNRRLLKLLPLAERQDRVHIERDHVASDAKPVPLAESERELVEETAARIRKARGNDCPRMMAFGAHTIKNGLTPVLIELIESGWLTHLATNGAGIIHDWEFAYQGSSSEDVRANVEAGRFGLWEETGYYINLAILVGAYRGLGYGESVGALVHEQGLNIPNPKQLAQDVVRSVEMRQRDFSAATIDLLNIIDDFETPGGWTSVPHPYRHYGLQAAAYRLGVPYTGHPMIGHDIIYEHPINSCAAIGRTAQRDFLTFADAVSRLSGGVYLSVGSAVMSPMVFEKSMAMAQNLALQTGKRIHDHFIAVVDLQPSSWDWRKGEPPEDNPDYYLRFNKSFSRMGGDLRYLNLDNRDFLLALLQALENPVK